MPHLIIESSIALTSNVVEDLHQTVGQQESVTPTAVKTRFYNPSLSFSGEQAGADHTALTLKLLPGRSLELKEQMAENLFIRATTLIENGTISVEIVDLGIYKK